MLPPYFVYLAALLNLSATAHYIYAVLRGRARPNRVTWLVWSLAPLISSAAQFYSHVGLSTLFIFMCAISTLTVFLCSLFFKQAYWKIDGIDYLCGSLALIGLAAWQITANADLAIFFSILADFFAALPTMRKSWNAPDSESNKAFMLAMLSTYISLASVQSLSFTALGFNACLCFNSTAICLILNRSRLLRLIGVPA